MLLSQGCRAPTCGLQVDGAAHVVQVDKEATGTRMIVNGRNCVLAQDKDPSRLMAASAGKLMRHLVPDGSLIEADQPYAEVWRPPLRATGHDGAMMGP